MEQMASAQVYAAWAQAILSALAILASTGIAVWVPARERRLARERESRARLDVRATRRSPNGMMLEIRYLPEFTNAAIQARIFVTSPGAVLYGGRVALNPAPMAHGGYVKYELNGMCIGGETVVGLLPSMEDHVFSGAVFLLGDPETQWIVKNANIEVTITNAVETLLPTCKLFVSPIEEGPGTVFMEPVPLHSPI